MAESVQNSILDIKSISFWIQDKSHVTPMAPILLSMTGGDGDLIARCFSFSREKTRRTHVFWGERVHGNKGESLLRTVDDRDGEVEAQESEFLPDRLSA